MAQQTINVGTSPNDGTGDTLRASQVKANANFTELYNFELQDILDNGHSLTGNNLYLGTGAGAGNTNTYLNAIGANSGYINSGNNVNLLGQGAGSANSGNNVNAIGTSASGSNTGNHVNAIGYSAGNNNTGEFVNAIGNGAALNNTGESVNAIGAGAGDSNTFDYCNLFGVYASADEAGQTVFSKDGAIMARISTLNLSATQKYTLADNSGILSPINIADDFANDTLAAAGNIQIGSLYHTAGVVKVRLT